MDTNLLAPLFWTSRSPGLVYPDIHSMVFCCTICYLTPENFQLRTLHPTWPKTKQNHQSDTRRDESKHWWGNRTKGILITAAGNIKSEATVEQAVSPPLNRLIQYSNCIPWDVPKGFENPPPTWLFTTAAVQICQNSEATAMPFDEQTDKLCQIHTEEYHSGFKHELCPLQQQDQRTDRLTETELLPRSDPDGLVRTERKGHMPPSLTQKLSPVDNHLQMKI